LIKLVTWRVCDTSACELSKHIAPGSAGTFFFIINGCPRELGASEVRSFLTYLAVKERVAAATQNQAFHALLFLYRQVLKVELPEITGVERARAPALPGASECAR
jgi:hypothetical protein